MSGHVVHSVEMYGSVLCGSSTKIHAISQLVKAANLSRYFPPWTVTRSQWLEMTRPVISGVAIDTLLFSRIGVPLFHRYRIVSRSGTHAVFRGTYMRRLHAFLEESDEESVRRHHRRCAREMAARMLQSSSRDVSTRRTVTHRTVSRAQRPRKSVRRAGFSRASDTVSESETYTVQALMDLALPRFAGLGDGPRQVHEPWAISAASPASPATSRLDTSGEEDRAGLSSPCLNLDGLSSSDDDTGASVGLSDLSVTLLCGSDEVFSPVNSDQVLSDVDFPPEPVSRDKRQVVQMRDVSPDVLLVDASLARRSGDPQRSIARVPLGKRMPGEVSMTVSPVPPSVMVTCTTGFVPMSTQPPVVTSVPAMSTATVTCEEIDVRVGRSDVDLVPRLGPASSSAGERVQADALSSPPLSGPPVTVLVGESELSSAPMSEHTVPVPMEGMCASRPLLLYAVVRSVVRSFVSDVGLGGCGRLVGTLVLQQCSGGALSGRSGRGAVSFMCRRYMY